MSRECIFLALLVVRDSLLVIPGKLEKDTERAVMVKVENTVTVEATCVTVTAEVTVEVIVEAG